MPVKKVRDVIRELEADGWYFVRQSGSHRQYHHPTKMGTVTVSGKPGDDMDTGTYGNIRRQAQVR